MVKRTIILLIISIIGMAFLGSFFYEEKITEEINHQNIEKKLPKVSIIMDDLGNNFSIDKKIEKIDIDLTLAILPFRKDTKKSLNFFSNKKEIILHLPLEPISKNQMEKEMITTSMNKKEIKETFNFALNQLKPHAVGVNNHKGSLFTANKESMKTLLKEIKENNLFFIDSFTIGSSKGYSLSKEMNIKTERRDVFLDNPRKKEDIKKKLHQTINIAEEKGKAVAIGHSFPETIEVLIEEVPSLKNRVNFVKVSEIVK